MSKKWFHNKQLFVQDLHKLDTPRSLVCERSCGSEQGLGGRNWWLVPFGN